MKEKKLIRNRVSAMSEETVLHSEGRPNGGPPLRTSQDNEREPDEF